ncbi:MAG TPA: PRC-barrel domain-containing protein [Reyranella sp.]|nr:PRC-barrel domain-containing protein [Reyranella sp.]
MKGNRHVLAIAISMSIGSMAAAVAQTGAAGGADSSRGTASPAVTAPAGGAATSTGSATSATHELKAVRLSKLEDVNIYDSNSKKIGEVEDLVLDPASGRVLHALVSIGGVMGVGDKDYAVPLKQLRVFSRSAEDGVPVKVELGAAPDSLTPAKRLDKDSPYVMGTKLIGSNVNDSGGKEAGEIEDLIVDLQEGIARVALVEFEKDWSLGDKLVAFPLADLRRDQDGKKLALDVSKETVAQKPSIEKSRVDKVDLSSQPWMQAAAGAGGGTEAAGPSAAGAGSTEASKDGSTPAAGAGPADAGSAPAVGAPAGK